MASTNGGPKKARGPVRGTSTPILMVAGEPCWAEPCWLAQALSIGEPAVSNVAHAMAADSLLCLLILCIISSSLTDHVALTRLGCVVAPTSPRCAWAPRQERTSDNIDGAARRKPQLADTGRPCALIQHRQRPGRRSPRTVGRVRVTFAS